MGCWLRFGLACSCIRTPYVSLVAVCCRLGSWEPLSVHGQPPILELLLEGALGRPSPMPCILPSLHHLPDQAEIGGTECTGHPQALCSVRPCSSCPPCASVSPPCCHSERNSAHPVPIASPKQLGGWQGGQRRHPEERWEHSGHL